MPLVLWICAAVAVGLYIVGPIQDPDLWWHIATGRWILSHGSVPSEDPFGIFSHGQPWRAYSWSNEVVYALAERAGGIEGLLWLKIALAIALVMSLAATFSLIARDWFLGLLLGVFATVATYNHFTLRPQSLVWIVFAWLLVVADSIDRDGLTRKRQLALLALMAVWANTHLSAALGLAAVALWTFGEGTPPYAAAVRRSVQASLMCLLGTIITPYLGGEWITFFSKTAHPAEFRMIAEFQPATVMQYSTGFLIVAAMLLLFLSLGRTRRLPLAKFALWASFCLGSLAVIKFLPFAVILTCALIARTLADLRAQGAITLVSVTNVLQGLEHMRRGLNKIPKEGLSFVFLCLGIVSVYRVMREPLAYEVVPKLAVDFIESKHLLHPIANIFGHGGYLIYRFSDAAGTPIERVAIDGRTNLISKELWSAYSAAARGARNWRDYLDMVKPETILWREDSPLVSILLAENRWCLVFESGAEKAKTLVFVKREYFESRKSEFSSLNCG